MKKFIFIFFTLVQSSVFAQSDKPAPDQFPDCPPETCPGFVISIETLNFHKPRTGCNSGFGFCFKLNAYFDCIPCAGKSTIESGKATIYGHLSKGEVTLEIPASLQMEKSFEKESMEIFEVEDHTISINMPDGKIVYLKGGSYNTEKYESSILVKIPLTD